MRSYSWGVDSGLLFAHSGLPIANNVAEKDVPGPSEDSAARTEAALNHGAAFAGLLSFSTSKELQSEL